MTTLKRIPWISLGLVLLTYTSLGWLLTRAHTPLYVWIAIAIAILLLLELLTVPWQWLVKYSSSIFDSAFRSFLISLLAACLLFFMIFRFRIFLDVLVIVAATMLARIDFQTAKLSQVITFWMLALFSLSGLSIGFFLKKLLVQGISG